MKIYIASSWKNQEAVFWLANSLENYGFEVDAFCRSTDKRFAFHWSEMVDDEIDLLKYDALSFLNDAKVQRAYNEDKKWLDWADTVIMLMPCGRSSHLEGGYGKGQGKHLFLFGEFPKGEFDVMYALADGLFRTNEFEVLLNKLNELL